MPCQSSIFAFIRAGIYLGKCKAGSVSHVCVFTFSSSQPQKYCLTSSAASGYINKRGLLLSFWTIPFAITSCSNQKQLQSIMIKWVVARQAAFTQVLIPVVRNVQTQNLCCIPICVKFCACELSHSRDQGFHLWAGYYIRQAPDHHSGSLAFFAMPAPSEYWALICSGEK